MATHRLPFTHQEHQTLEIYYFKLIQFTETAEYKYGNSITQHKIQDEISYMAITLGILARVFGDHTNNHKPIMAWPVETDDPMSTRAYRFSSAKVAALSLGCNQSHVTSVCKGHKAQHLGNKELSSKYRNSTGGWTFCYEELYEDNIVHYNMMTGKFE